MTHREEAMGGEGGGDFNFTDYLTPGRIIVVSVMLIILITVVSVLGSLSSLKTEGVTRQSALNGQYMDNQNDLSSYISGFYEQTGLANLKSKMLDKILTDAVKGRYVGHTSAQPGQGQLFSAITEAYPTIDLTVYDKIVEYVKGGRREYADKQSKLLDMLQKYDVWRTAGLFRPMLISWLGFPTQDLKACVGTDCRHGADAEARMWNIVLAPAAADAYATSKMAPLTPPND